MELKPGLMSSLKIQRVIIPSVPYLLLWCQPPPAFNHGSPTPAELLI